MVSPWPSSRLSSLSRPACEVPVLAKRAAMAATIAISTRLIAFMFSLALSTVIREAHRVVVRAGPTATPHTTQESHVSEMRDFTYSSYASLIVDGGNIKQRHRRDLAYHRMKKVCQRNFWRSGARRDRRGGRQHEVNGRPSLRTRLTGSDTGSPLGVSHAYREITAQSW